MACLGDGEQAHLGTLPSKHQSLAGWSYSRWSFRGGPGWSGASASDELGELITGPALESPGSLLRLALSSFSVALATCRSLSAISNKCPHRLKAAQEGPRGTPRCWCQVPGHK